MWPNIRNALLMQRGQLLLWAPVALGCGIGIYFLLRVEPSWGVIAGLLAAAFLALCLGGRAGESCAPIIWGAGLVALGVALGALRAQAVAAPVLTFHYYGPIEGTVLRVDQSSSGATRVLLGDLRLSRMDPDRVPVRARISLHNADGLTGPQPGMRVMTTGHLSAPNGPTEPGGFDFRRHAWFMQLGAVGYTRVPLLLYDQHDGGVARARYDLAYGVAARIGGPEGAFAAAITAGDRSAMGQADLDALRHSNLAHLLAISGLHMGLLTGFVFLALQQGMALVPGAALRLPLRKIAACGAILVGAVYLVLSGGAVSTERAFIMVTMMFIAVLFDRAALTLRAVALAALVVLALRPEALVSPGFQMSFAATAALVGAFAILRARIPLRGIGGGIVSLFVSSLVAGMATAPFAAAHFNQVPHYGILANMLSVPVMGSIIMPAAVAAALLEPLGLAAPALWVMKTGLSWILAVAHWVADLPRAVSYVPMPPRAVLPLISAGGLVCLIWQGRLRWAGALPVLLGLVLWVGQDRPPLLIAQSGGLAGVMTPQGRALTRATGDGFAARAWLTHDGAPVSQADAAARPGWAREGRVFRASIGGAQIMLVRGKTALAQIADCGGVDILITNVRRRDAELSERSCTVIDADLLADTGAQAFWPANGRFVTVRDIAGARLWSSHAPMR